MVSPWEDLLQPHKRDFVHPTLRRVQELAFLYRRWVRSPPAAWGSSWDSSLSPKLTPWNDLSAYNEWLTLNGTPILREGRCLFEGALFRPSIFHLSKIFSNRSFAYNHSRRTKRVCWWATWEMQWEKTNKGNNYFKWSKLFVCLVQVCRLLSKMSVFYHVSDKLQTTYH